MTETLRRKGHRTGEAPSEGVGSVAEAKVGGTSQQRGHVVHLVIWELGPL